jgi:hypothetical protein
LKSGFYNTTYDEREVQVNESRKRIEEKEKSHGRGSIRRK